METSGNKQSFITDVDGSNGGQALNVVQVLIDEFTLMLFE